MLAYCHALGLTRAVLVHPDGETAPSGTVVIRGAGAMSVEYEAMGLRSWRKELERQGQELAKRICTLEEQKLLAAAR
jgi:hypothetical protein